MIRIENLKVYACTLYTCTSDGQPVKGTGREVRVLFNQTQISEEEVSKLFERDMWEYDPRVTPITKQQLEMLHDKREEVK